MSDRFEVRVTFDTERGYIGSAPALRQPIVALSLGGLRRRIEILMLPDDVRVVLQLDGLAEPGCSGTKCRPRRTKGASYQASAECLFRSAPNFPEKPSNAEPNASRFADSA